MSFLGAIVALWYTVLDDRAPVLLALVLCIGPGIVVTATGLFLLGRNGTYSGPDRCGGGTGFIGGTESGKQLNR